MSLRTSQSDGVVTLVPDLEVPQPSEPSTPVVPDAPVTPADPDPGTPADPEEPATVPAPQEPATPAVPEPSQPDPGQLSARSPIRELGQRAQRDSAAPVEPVAAGGGVVLAGAGDEALALLG